MSDESADFTVLARLLKESQDLMVRLVERSRDINRSHKIWEKLLRQKFPISADERAAGAAGLTEQGEILKRIESDLDQVEALTNEVTPLMRRLAVNHRKLRSLVEQFEAAVGRYIRDIQQPDAALLVLMRLEEALEAALDKMPGPAVQTPKRQHKRGVPVTPELARRLSEAVDANKHTWTQAADSMMLDVKTVRKVKRETGLIDQPTSERIEEYIEKTKLKTRPS